jgi:hypothetical protein
MHCEVYTETTTTTLILLLLVVQHTTIEKTLLCFNFRNGICWQLTRAALAASPL